MRCEVDVLHPGPQAVSMVFDVKTTTAVPTLELILFLPSNVDRCMGGFPAPVLLSSRGDGVS